MSLSPATPNIMAVNGDLVKAGVEAVINTVSLKDEDKQEIERLESQHDLYKTYRPLWDFYLAAYEGGPSMINEANLFRYPREHEDDWRERLRRAHYHNYCDRLVDFFTDFIFAETIDRNGGTEAQLFDEFIADVNKKGDGVEAFMKQVCDDMQIFGMVYVLVDAPRKDPRVIRSKYDETQYGLNPYWVLIKPQEILDWVTDEFDRYTYVKRYQYLIQLNGKIRQTLFRFTEWYPDTIQITDVDVTDQKNPKIIKHDPLQNALGEVPIEIIRYKRSKEHRFMGNAFLRDLSLNNREVMNVTSMEQEFLYKQCFNVMAMERDSNLNIAEQQDGDWGVSNLIYYPKDGKPPQYITPSADPAKYMYEYRMNCVQEMYKRAAQDMVNELFNGHKSSGFSKSMSFSTTVPQIAGRAETLEQAENRLMTRTLKYVGKKWNGKIKYKDRYEITNITDAIAQLTSLFKDCQMPSSTFIKEELKRLVHEYDGKLPADILDTVHKEIEAMNMTEFFDTQKLAYIGRAAMSPDAPLVFGDKPDQGGNASKQAPPKASTPTRASSSSAEIRSESTKRKKGT